MIELNKDIKADQTVFAKKEILDREERLSKIVCSKYDIEDVDVNAFLEDEGTEVVHDYQRKHEPCLYGWKEGAAHYFVDKRNLTTIIERLKDLDSMTKKEMLEILKQLLGGDVPTTVIDCPKPAKNPDHPTMKPVPLIGKLISNSSRMGELVLDIFGGSGTTLIACTASVKMANISKR